MYGTGGFQQESWSLPPRVHSVQWWCPGRTADVTQLRRGEVSSLPFPSGGRGEQLPDGTFDGMYLK